MILSFGSKLTEKIWLGKIVKNIPEETQCIMRRMLRILNNLENWSDLKNLQSERLESLSGSDHSILKINEKYRIVFRWIENNTQDVEIINNY